jgi:hypothetical protein
MMEIHANVAREEKDIAVKTSLWVNYLAQRAVVALLVAASGAGGADDNHASTLAAVLIGRHVGDVGW